MNRSDWSADYPSIENFLNPLYRTGGSSNDSNYSNPEVDKLLEQADGTADEDEAIKLYQQAEKLVAKDMPSMPTWNEKGIGASFQEPARRQADLHPSERRARGRSASRPDCRTPEF